VIAPWFKPFPRLLATWHQPPQQQML